MRQTIRWGIIGPGTIAHQFANDIRFAPSAELVAIASRGFSRSQGFAGLYNIPKAYGSYQELLDDADIDAVYIATPHTFHLEQSQTALRAGKAVLCEKPLCISVDECEALISTAEQEKRYVLEGMWTLFLPAIQRARRWVEEGEIGDILHLKADFGYPQTPYHPEKRQYNAELAGGCLLDMGIYPIAMMEYFVGKAPKTMKSAVKYAPNGVEDDLTVLCDYGDCVASIGASFRCRLANSCYLVGTKGFIHIPDFFRASEAQLFKDETLIDVFKDGRQGGGFEFEVEAMCQDLTAGKTESDIIPLSRSLALQKLMNDVKNDFKGQQ